MSETVDKFIKANKKSPVVEGVMLDGNKRDIGSFDEYNYMRYKLEDGQVFDIPAEEMKILSQQGFVPDWSI